MTDLFKTASVPIGKPCEGSVQVVLDQSFEGTTPEIGSPRNTVDYPSVSNLHRDGNANHRVRRAQD